MQQQESCEKFHMNSVMKLSLEYVNTYLQNADKNAWMQKHKKYVQNTWSG